LRHEEFFSGLIINLRCAKITDLQAQSVFLSPSKRDGDCIILMAAAFNFFPTFLICESAAEKILAADLQIDINEI
jgi:hypothetical protein